MSNNFWLDDHIIDKLERWLFKFRVHKDNKYLVLPLPWWVEVFTELGNIDNVIGHYNVKEYGK